MKTSHPNDGTAGMCCHAQYPECAERGCEEACRTKGCAECRGKGPKSFTHVHINMPVKLCAHCIADMINNPYSVRLQGIEGYSTPEQLVREIELHALGDAGRHAIIWDGNRSGPERQLTLRAVTEVNGIPACAWCIAARRWTPPAGSSYPR